MWTYQCCQFIPKMSHQVDLTITSPVSLPACMHDGNAGTLFEDHVVLADYEASTNSEISAKAGDKVKVIKKEDSGLYPWMSQLPALFSFVSRPSS